MINMNALIKNVLSTTFFICLRGIGTGDSKNIFGKKKSDSPFQSFGSPLQIAIRTHPYFTGQRSKDHKDHCLKLR